MLYINAMVLMNLFTGQQWRCRHIEQTCGRSGGRRGREESREWPGNMYITICKLDSQWEIRCMMQEAQTSALWHPRGVGQGGRWEGGSRKGRGTCVYLWLTHVDVWLRPPKYCKAIILLLQINKLKKKSDLSKKPHFYQDGKLSVSVLTLTGAFKLISTLTEHFLSLLFLDLLILSRMWCLFSSGSSPNIH